MIDLLVEEANKYGAIPKTKSATGKAELLKEAARRIKCSLKDCLGSEVDKHLDRIARILVEKQMAKGWNMWTNSCQWLVMRLLDGKDFESIIPRFVDKPEEADEESVRWPRYLISFGPNIEGFNQSFYQPSSMITDFCQSRPTIDYDLIEHISLRLKESPETLPASWIHLSLCEAELTGKTGTDSPISMDALWAMPCDTLSILQFHLLRQPSKYESEGNWSQNRFRVLELLDIFASLAGALGASLGALLSRDSKFLSQIIVPSARVFGNILATEHVRIVRLSSRWVGYDITNRVPSAMGEARRLRRKLQKAAGAPGDPVHGEEVLSTLVEIFLTPLAVVGGGKLAENFGQIFRFYHNGPWITLNGFGHTLVCPLFVRKVNRIRS